MSLLEDLALLRTALGPQRVKTKDVEIEQFGLDSLIRAANRTSAKRVHLSQFQCTIAIPKCGKYCGSNCCTDTDPPRYIPEE